MVARLNPELIQKSIQTLNLALKEDAARSDITSQLFVPANQKATAHLIAKQPGIWCGDALIAASQKIYQYQIIFQKKISDGGKFKRGQILLKLSGHLRSILGLERSLLNLLQHLCGISTQTAQFVQRAKNIRILDTRKTTAGLRVLQRYAVRVGGGGNHRFNLNSAYLIKANHLAKLTRPLKALIHTARSHRKPIILEAENIRQVREFLNLKVDRILLDNFSPPQIKQALALRKKSRHHIPFEISGGINLDNIRRYAASGVEFISVGCITHSSPSIDLSLKVKSQ